MSIKTNSTILSKIQETSILMKSQIPTLFFMRSRLRANIPSNSFFTSLQIKRGKGRGQDCVN